MEALDTAQSMLTHYLRVGPVWSGSSSPWCMQHLDIARTDSELRHFVGYPVVCLFGRSASPTQQNPSPVTFEVERDSDIKVLEKLSNKLPGTVRADSASGCVKQSQGFKSATGNSSWNTTSTYLIVGSLGRI